MTDRNSAQGTHSSWLGLPTLSELIEPSVLAHLAQLAALAGGTAFQVIESRKTRVASAGTPHPCPLCEGHGGQAQPTQGTPFSALTRCAHGVCSAELPLVVEHSRLGFLRVGPFSLEPLPDGSPATDLVRASAAAELLASAITDRLEAAHLRRALSVDPGKADELLQLALEASSDAIWDWDLTTNKTYYSPRWFEMLGYAPGAFESDFDTWASMTLPEDVASTVAIVQKAIEDNTGYESLFRMRHANGSLLWIRGRGRVTGRDANGRPIRMSGTNTDITSLKTSEEQQSLIEARWRESEKITAIGRLAGGVAHDFNNQLMVILGNASLLRERVQSPQAQAFIDNVLSATSRCSDLTQQLLAFARVGKQSRGDVDLNAIVHEVATLVGVAKSFDVVEDTLEERADVIGDASLLRSAVLNMVLNARDAMTERGGELRLETRREHIDPAIDADIPEGLQAGEYIVLRIRDTGCGIPEDVRAHIFEPFFSTKPVGQGTGMGLAAVSGTVQAHEGAIRVESEVNRGTTFHVYLPAKPRDVRGGDALHRGASKGRILVIDDEPLVRDALCALISALDYDAEACASGEEALKRMAQNDEVDLVILDLVLPGMKGPDIFRELRRRRPGLRVVIATGFGQGEECEALLAQGAVGALAKPFRAPELAKTISTALGKPA